MGKMASSKIGNNSIIVHNFSFPDKTLYKRTSGFAYIAIHCIGAASNKLLSSEIHVEKVFGKLAAPRDVNYLHRIFLPVPCMLPCIRRYILNVSR